MVDLLTPESQHRVGSILLVDNYQEHLKPMARFLRNRGHSVVECEDRASALQAFRTSTEGFDIVFTDLHLGEFDPRGGAELTKEIKKEREKRGYDPAPLLLCITGFYKDPRVELEMEKEGARYVIKSSDPEVYLHTIQTMLLDLEQLRGNGPLFEIVHSNSPDAGQICYPGEEVDSISLVDRATRFPVKIAKAPRHVFDYVARYISRPQTAEQIAYGLSEGSAFYHEMYAGEEVSARSIITNINRIRDELGNTFSEAGLRLDPYKVLASEKNVDGDEVYSLKARISVEHPVWAASNL